MPEGEKAGRQEGREGGRKDGRKEGRKEGRQAGRQVSRQAGRQASWIAVFFLNYCALYKPPYADMASDNKQKWCLLKALKIALNFSTHPPKINTWMIHSFLICEQFHLVSTDLLLLSST